MLRIENYTIINSEIRKIDIKFKNLANGSILLYNHSHSIFRDIETDIVSCEKIKNFLKK